MLNKKAQISDVMTWIIATIAIIAILIIFVYASTILAQKTKVIKIKSLTLDLDKEVDLLETKTSLAYLSASSEQKNIIDNYLEGKNNEP